MQYVRRETPVYCVLAMIKSIDSIPFLGLVPRGGCCGNIPLRFTTILFGVQLTSAGIVLYASTFCVAEMICGAVSFCSGLSALFGAITSSPRVTKKSILIQYLNLFLLTFFFIFRTLVVFHVISFDSFINMHPMNHSLLSLIPSLSQLPNIILLCLYIGIGIASLYSMTVTFSLLVVLSLGGKGERLFSAQVMKRALRCFNSLDPSGTITMTGMRRPNGPPNDEAFLEFVFLFNPLAAGVRRYGGWGAAARQNGNPIYGLQAGEREDLSAFGRKSKLVDMTSSFIGLFAMGRDEKHINNIEEYDEKIYCDGRWNQPSFLEEAAVKASAMEEGYMIPTVDTIDFSRDVFESEDFDEDGFEGKALILTAHQQKQQALITLSAKNNLRTIENWVGMYFLGLPIDGEDSETRVGSSDLGSDGCSQDEMLSSDFDTSLEDTEEEEKEFMRSLASKPLSRHHMFAGVHGTIVSGKDNEEEIKKSNLSPMKNSEIPYISCDNREDHAHDFSSFQGLPPTNCHPGSPRFVSKDSAPPINKKNRKTKTASQKRHSKARQERMRAKLEHTSHYASVFSILYRLFYGPNWRTEPFGPACLPIINSCVGSILRAVRGSSKALFCLPLNNSAVTLLGSLVLGGTVGQFTANPGSVACFISIVLAGMLWLNAAIGASSNRPGYIGVVAVGAMLLALSNLVSGMYRGFGILLPVGLKGAYRGFTFSPSIAPFMRHNNIITNDLSSSNIQLNESKHKEVEDVVTLPEMAQVLQVGNGEVYKLLSVTNATTTNDNRKTETPLEKRLMDVVTVEAHQPKYEQLIEKSEQELKNETNDKVIVVTIPVEEKHNHMEPKDGEIEDYFTSSFVESKKHNFEMENVFNSLSVDKGNAISKEGYETKNSSQKAIQMEPGLLNVLFESLRLSMLTEEPPQKQNEIHHEEELNKNMETQQKIPMTVKISLFTRLMNGFKGFWMTISSIRVPDGESVLLIFSLDILMTLLCAHHASVLETIMLKLIQDSA